MGCYTWGWPPTPAVSRRVEESQKAHSLAPKQFCQARNPSLCLSHLLWLMCNMESYTDNYTGNGWL